MAETSFWWTTDGIGDGKIGGYTRADHSLWTTILAACCGKEGVAPGYGNALAAAANGANTVTVPTGGALVDGKPYNNSTPVDVTIPSASGAGNTRIDRVVLRADWAAQTVRITRIAGVDAASPSAPAPETTSGTLYDILICQVLVNTAGAVTVTDERVMADVPTIGIENNAVTNPKLRDSSALSVIGRAANSVGDPADIVASANDRLLARVANALSWVQLTIGMIPDALITGAKLVANAVGNAQFRQSAGVSVVGRSANSTGNVADISAGSNDTLLRRVSNALSFGQLTLGMIPDLLITSAKLAAGAVTAGKLANGAVDTTARMANDIVDDTKVGNRVLALPRRQGGDAANWAVQGTTTYTPTNVRMQVGSLEMGNSGTWTVTFPQAFSNRPIVTFNTYRGDYLPFGAGTPTASGFSVEKSDITADILFWIAIGPE